MSDAEWSNIDRDYERTRRVVETHIAKLKNAGFNVNIIGSRDENGDSLSLVRVPNLSAEFKYTVYHNAHITNWLIENVNQFK